MTQHEQVIEILKKNGGFATLGFLNQNVDVSKWGTKTPFATIRRIVQQRDEILRIKPGLWALKEFKNRLPDNIISLKSTDQKTKKKSEHSYYQGLLVEIGNLKKYETFVPNQDKNKEFLQNKLKDIISLTQFYDFTHSEVVRYAKTIDVVWFNERKLPAAFFEIEHSTDIKNSLTKFVELQDFNTKFYIVANEVRKNEFNDKLMMTSFKDITNRVTFLDYEKLSVWHSKSFEVHSIERMLDV